MSFQGRIKASKDQVNGANCHVIWKSVKSINIYKTSISVT